MKSKEEARFRNMDSCCNCQHREYDVVCMQVFSKCKLVEKGHEDNEFNKNTICDLWEPT